MSILTKPIAEYMTEQRLSLDDVGKKFTKLKTSEDDAKRPLHKTTIKAALDAYRPLHVVFDAVSGKPLRVVEIKTVWIAID